MSQIKRIVRNILNGPHILKSRLIFLVAGVSYPVNSVILGKIRIRSRGEISIGRDCRINGGQKYNPIGFDEGCNIVTEQDAKISIGESFRMSNSTLYARKKIEIGDRVMFGNGVKIYDTDFHSLDYRFRGTPQDKQHTVCRPIVIGNDVFIGAGSIILKGVSIGDRAVIGAGSIVTKAVGKDEIWAGNPARFIGKNANGE